MKVSWLSRLWFLYFIFPFKLILDFIDINYNHLVDKELYIFIFLIVMSVAWLIGLYFVIKWVKKVINN